MSLVLNVRDVHNRLFAGEVDNNESRKCQVSARKKAAYVQARDNKTADFLGKVAQEQASASNASRNGGGTAD